MGVDAIVMRQKQEGSPWFADRCVDPIIINAGDGAHEHPTQGLLDMFTIQEVKGHINGLKVVIVGDIDHGRVARSNIYGLKTMGADVHLVGPRTLLQPELEAMGVKVHYDLKEAIQMQTSSTSCASRKNARASASSPALVNTIRSSVSTATASSGLKTTSSSFIRAP